MEILQKEAALSCGSGPDDGTSQSDPISKLTTDSDEQKMLRQNGRRSSVARESNRQQSRFIMMLIALCVGASMFTIIGYFAVEVDHNSQAEYKHLVQKIENYVEVVKEDLGEVKEEIKEVKEELESQKFTADSVVPSLPAVVEEEENQPVAPVVEVNEKNKEQDSDGVAAEDQTDEPQPSAPDDESIKEINDENPVFDADKTTTETTKEYGERVPNESTARSNADDNTEETTPTNEKEDMEDTLLGDTVETPTSTYGDDGGKEVDEVVEEVAANVAEEEQPTIAAEVNEEVAEGKDTPEETEASDNEANGDEATQEDEDEPSSAAVDDTNAEPMNVTEGEEPSVGEATVVEASPINSSNKKASGNKKKEKKNNNGGNKNDDNSSNTITEEEIEAGEGPDIIPTEVERMEGSSKTNNNITVTEAAARNPSNGDKESTHKETAKADEDAGLEEAPVQGGNEDVKAGEDTTSGVDNEGNTEDVNNKISAEAWEAKHADKKVGEIEPEEWESQETENKVKENYTTPVGDDSSGRSTKTTIPVAGVELPKLGGATGVDLLDRNKLLELAEQQKEVLLEKLYKDYGEENFNKIYKDSSSGGYRGITANIADFRKLKTRSIPIPVTADKGAKSMKTLKRKMMMKVLKVQIQIAQERENNGLSDVAAGVEEKKRRNLRKNKNKKKNQNQNQNQNQDKDEEKANLDQNNDAPSNGDSNDGSSNVANEGDGSDSSMFGSSSSTNTYYESYVWATGGHSAAAGHGNMFNESYTAYMSRDMQPFFAAFGINLDARNYAMGGTKSSTQVSSSYEQIFGTDVDIFSWDFGMTDGTKDPSRILHYAYRGGLSQGHPAFVALRSSNQNQLGLLADRGLATFTFTDKKLSEMREGIPDSADGLSDEEIAAMPEYVRNFKCGTSIEGGDPYCGDEKYTKYFCPNRALRAGWHPGFKAQAMDGHMISLFLMQAFFGALKDLSENEEKEPQVLLDQLQKEDDEVYKQFANKRVFPTTDGGHKGVGFKDQDLKEDKALLELLYKGYSISRTGLLPARSRYLGHMTDIDKQGDIALLGNETYDTGIEFKEAVATASETNQEMRLVYTNDNKNRNWECREQQLKPDYKDFWLAHYNDGLVKFPTFPNAKEKNAYDYKANKSKIKGLLCISPTSCPWGKCQKGDLRLIDKEGNSALDKGTLAMTVNGQAVKSVLQLDGILALVGEHGMYWKPRKNGTYDITVHVKEEGAVFRISSVVLY